MTLKRPVTFVSILVGTWLAFFSFAYAEKISDFQSEVTLREDGSFIVTETIVYDFEAEQRRGIYRNISNQHPQSATTWYKERYIDLALLAVRRNGQPEQYVIEEYDGLSVRIGNPDSYLSGEHEYEITYEVDGAIANFAGFQEFYWNVTGSEWSVPIEQASLVLNGPATVLQDQSTCYVGAAGSSQSCTSATKVSATRYEYHATRLAPGEQLTVAQEIQLTQTPAVYERANWFWFVVGGIIVWFGGLSFLVYRWKMHHKTDAPVIVEYEPLSDFKPMYTGVLLDGRLDPHDIAAGLVYLAEQGFIIIKEVKRDVLFFTLDDYEVTLKRPISEAETEFHKTILHLLFGESVSIWKRVLTSFGDASVADDSRPESVGTTVTLSKLKKNRKKLQQNARAIQALKSAVKTDLKARGYFESGVPFFASGNTGAFLFISGLFLAGVFWLTQSGFLVLLLIIGTGVVLAFGYERRTKKGHEALRYLEGFKHFLSTTEKERYTFHNAPRKNPEQFMEYLPYAIAFGVEKEWAAVFSDIQISNPDWYQTSAPTASFNTAAFSHSITSFSSSFSTSSGSSGSSGGGSAGGGSGGGGGGSW